MNLKHGPSLLIVDLTALCNEACDFCWRRDPAAVADVYRREPTHTMPMSVYREIMEQASRVKSLQYLSVCGPMGDASLVPDLVERGMLAMSLGFTRRLLNTNGVALDRHDPANLLIAFNHTKVSIDTLKPDVYKEMHGRDQLERVLRNVRTLASHGRLSIKMTVTDRNRDELPAIRSFASSIDVALVVKPLHSFIDVVGGTSNSDAGARHCDQPFATVNFNYKGEMTTCCLNYKLEPTFGVLGDIKSLWEGVAFEEWRDSRLDGLCKGCSGTKPRTRARER